MKHLGRIGGVSKIWCVLRHLNFDVGSNGLEIVKEYETEWEGSNPLDLLVSGDGTRRVWSC